jgi:hypothetical protein
MLASICSEPKVLEVMRIVNIFISIIRIVVPILLIFVLIFKLISAITSNDNDSLAKVKKTAIPNIVAAVIIFILPTLINLIVKITFPNNDYINCLKVTTTKEIQNIYLERIEALVSKAEETFNINDYNNAMLYLSNIKDEEKKKEYEERLKIVKDKIDEMNKTNEQIGTGLGKDIVPTEELIEACNWVLHDEEVQIKLMTWPPGPYKYTNPDIELPGGSTDISTGQAAALKTISLFEYQKGVFFGEEKIEVAPDSRYAFMIIYKTVLLHNTVWRAIANHNTFGSFDMIYYNAGSCSQNYRNSLRVSKYDSGKYKAEIDDAVENTRYLVLANEDGNTTDARYHSFTGIEQQIEAAGNQGKDFVEILENVIK